MEGNLHHMYKYISYSSFIKGTFCTLVPFHHKETSAFHMLYTFLSSCTFLPRDYEFICTDDWRFPLRKGIEFRLIFFLGQRVGNRWLERMFFLRALVTAFYPVALTRKLFISAVQAQMFTVVKQQLKHKSSTQSKDLQFCCLPSTRYTQLFFIPSLELLPVLWTETCYLVSAG